MRKFVYVITALFLLSAFIFTTTPVLAQTETPTPTPTPAASSQTSSIPDCRDNNISVADCTQFLQNKVNSLQGQAKTLSSQIAIMDNQVRLTEARIADAKAKIANLEKDIDITKGKVGTLEKTIQESTKALLGRITATYQVGSSSPWEIFLTSGNIGNFFTRLKYLRIVQAYDKKTIYAAEQAKVDYINQKAIFEDKQAEAEALSKKLDAYNSQLLKDKASKQSLLITTKNSEKEYQSRLAAAQRELQQIQSAAKFLITTEPKNVQRGEIIGLMGNSGYSTGAHLHFGVYNASSLEQYNYYSSYENPANVLEPKTVKWGTGCGNDPQGFSATGNGSFAWPIEPGTLYISQGFGATCWSWMYGGKPHPAFDIVGSLNSAVKAVESGKAYICRNCTGDGGNGVFLFHSNGKMTLYWHLQ